MFLGELEITNTGQGMKVWNSTGKSEHNSELSNEASFGDRE